MRRRTRRQTQLLARINLMASKPQRPPPPPHLTELLENLREVESLVAIHSVVAGTGAGRKHNVEVLNKSAIVLAVACWEAYVEDLAKAALELLVANARDHSIFPPNVLERVGSKHSGVKSWALAGEGWKKALNDNLKEVLAKTIGTLNTPRAEQVDELFTKTIGMSKLSATWSWKGRSSTQAVKALDDLITLRGSIAHRVKHSSAVHKTDVIKAVDLVSRVAAKSHNSTRAFLLTLLPTVEWNQVKYKGTA